MEVLLWILQGIMAFLTIPWGLITVLRREQRAYVHGPPEAGGMPIRLGTGQARRRGLAESTPPVLVAWGRLGPYPL
ncbi:hypothetical protein ITP53_32620 [Nonomuraea sp. K274]|uniref:Uncharacterized protein n=1 Tax=Nonomuraea cypriaca TaxID=1187855 RepID=A0A931AG09_9ACTN|nr:hypothetical protein [Nonomuraea cypriaca]MBF8190374.1 hypothetical protein [Nonomuraea cypriaca]